MELEVELSQVELSQVELSQVELSQIPPEMTSPILPIYISLSRPLFLFFSPIDHRILSFLTMSRRVTQRDGTRAGQLG